MVIKFVLYLIIAVILNGCSHGVSKEDKEKWDVSRKVAQKCLWDNVSIVDDGTKNVDGVVYILVGRCISYYNDYYNTVYSSFSSRGKVMLSESPALSAESTAKKDAYFIVRDKRSRSYFNENKSASNVVPISYINEHIKFLYGLGATSSVYNDGTITTYYKFNLANKISKLKSSVSKEMYRATDWQALTDDHIFRKKSPKKLVLSLQERYAELMVSCDTESVAYLLNNGVGLHNIYVDDSSVPNWVLEFYIPPYSCPKIEEYVTDYKREFYGYAKP